MIVASKLVNRIPVIRQKKGLSIMDLVRKSGLSYPTVSGIAGKDVNIVPDTMTIKSVRLVCESLGVGFDEAFELVID